MPNFALITEGITDQVLIETLLAAFYDEEPDVTEAQPLRDATDESRQATYAGWENVLKYCATDLFEQQFYTNHYVIIQIDTDVCGQKNFNINLKNGNKDRPTADIISDVCSHIISYIGTPVFQKYRERIIFAISIHPLECWLLPLFGKTAVEQKRTRQCAKHLEEVLKRFDLTHEKDYEKYRILSAKYLEGKNVERARQNNSSLDFFLASLPADYSDRL